MNAQDMIDFEAMIARTFNAGLIHAPIHLSGGNEQQLIDIFKDIDHEDYVFSTHRSHYHALLHGIDQQVIIDEILAGHSMNLNWPEHKFFTSAIVGGILPIALGVAMGIKLNGSNEHVWCFIGDMAATTGIFHECNQFAIGEKLPITFVIEDNGMSTDTPTIKAWGTRHVKMGKHIREYQYERQYPHVGTGKMVTFV